MYLTEILKDLFEIIMKNFTAYDDSPQPSEIWKNSPNNERIELLNKVIFDTVFNSFFDILSTKNDGQVIIRIKQSLSASERGTLLLDFEDYLKKNIDIGINVWAEALGDKNSLRNLRGIEVKHDK